MRVLNNIIKYCIRIICLIIKKNQAVKDYVFSSVLRKDINDYIENKYFAEYEHINKSISILKKNLSGRNFVILDIGGSTGKTAFMYSEAFPNNIVYVFEPIKETFQKLSQNISKHKNIIAINKAVGNKTGAQRINIAKRISSSSLYELNADRDSKIFSEILEFAGSENIEMCKLDDEINKDVNIGIIKIDVQGYELEVLKGAENTLKHTYFVILELNNHDGYQGSPKYYEIDSYLRDSNFLLFDIFPSTHDNNRLVEWDCIYINSSLV